MTFPHERLIAFHKSLKLTLGVERLATSLPRGYADLKDQVRRAASATTRNIAEGANRWAPKDKAARFTIAQGECGECDAALQMILELELGPRADVVSLRELADEVAAMLRGLIRCQSRRLASSDRTSAGGGTRP